MAQETHTVAFDPTNPEFRNDPYRFYRQLRENAPVFRNPTGGWLLTRYRDCAWALEDPRLRNVEDIRCYPDGAQAGGAGSDFGRIRGAVARALSPAVVRRYEPRVRQIVDELLDGALEAGEVDLVEALCHPLGAIVFCELFGVPADDRAVFRGWVDAVVQGVDMLVGVPDEVAARRDQAMAEFSEYFRGLIAERRGAPTADLLSELIAIADGDGDGELTEEELVSSCVILLITGHESTVNFVSNAVHALLTHPVELQRFRAEPELGPVAVDELMRYCSPANLVVRAARTALELDGHEIGEGEYVVPFLAAGNRDPEVFDDPERLDLTRRPNPHLAFGHGLHYCLGAALARMEGLVALRSVTNRAPDLALNGEPEFKPTIGLRGLARLPVRLR